MRLNDNVLFDFDDILIQPETLSTVRSRSEVNVRHFNDKLPLMTAPMDTVIDDFNYHYFKNLGIVPVLPRVMNTPNTRLSEDFFHSYSFDDFKRIFIDETVTPKNKYYALIDVANGHMMELYYMVKEAKLKYGKSLVLMVGNVATPETFKVYESLKVDYIRIGIGNGNGCLTTVQTGVGYPMASLIKDCYEIRDNIDVKIVADGGFKKYSDIIKGLALGADYIMLGSIFNKALESAGETMDNKDNVLNQYHDYTKLLFNAETPLYKVFRGMSTKEVQKSWGVEKLKTSEGIITKNKVEYTLRGWVDNFESYLKSTLSYTGKYNIQDFIGNVEFNLISNHSFNRFNK